MTCTNRPKIKLARKLGLGQSLFLHATSVGKLFSAHQPHLQRRLLTEPRPKLTERTLLESHVLEEEMARIRADGFAISREEAVPGIVGLAIPVRDAHGMVVAAIHISALHAQLTDNREQGLVAAATATASVTETELGYGPVQPEVAGAS